MKLILDTNTYSAFMKGDANAVCVVKKSSHIFLPVPVIGELKFGFANGTLGQKNEAILSQFLNVQNVSILPCDEHTAHFYAHLKYQLKKKGTPIPINDVWIAALAIQHELPLFTYDSDFLTIPQLALVTSAREL